MKTLWFDKSENRLWILDQRLLPGLEKYVALNDLEDFVSAIRDMKVRGAPLIGVTAAYGVYFALMTGWRRDEVEQRLKAARPTAVNLARAVDRVLAKSYPLSEALAEANMIEAEETSFCEGIGFAGMKLIIEIASRKPGRSVNILTHCNAGRLATTGIGTALAPIYKAHDAGIPIHVWVSETRPRLQGSKITAWELSKFKVPHTIVVDGAAASLMWRGEVDLVLVGADRVMKVGETINKIGTYDKALAARAHDVPFYVAFPSSTLDLESGIGEVEIESRGQEEIKRIGDEIVSPETSNALNPAFDVTPQRLVTGYITERGIFKTISEAIGGADEGVTKFDLDWTHKDLAGGFSNDLIRWREKLHDLRLVGENASGVGYGNLSERIDSGKEFIITGTQTGGLRTLLETHFSMVTDYSFATNWVEARGPVKPSSESLTHAAFYCFVPEAHAVIHVHDEELWKDLMKRFPTTDPSVAYGTVEMAKEMKRLASMHKLMRIGIIIAAGHRGGIFSIGGSVEEAASRIMKLTEECRGARVVH